jgi:hypothetical protein
MTEFTQPTTQPPAPDAGPSRLTGGRRAVASVLLTVGLFALGGTAVALAADPSASPAPSTSTTPTTPTQPSDGGTGAPSNGGTTVPSNRPNHAGKDCPNMGDDSGGSGGSGASPSTPTTPDDTATPSV